MAGVKVPYNLRLIALALVGLVLVGVAGFHFIEGWSWFDGFYMVITTFTTIGYQETHPLSHAGRVFNVGWVLYHLIEHEAGHRGQINLLRHLLRVR